MVINITELGKLIKSKKENVRWIVKEDYDLVTTDYMVFKIHVMHEKLLTKLLTKFQMKPEVNTGYLCREGNITKLENDTIINMESMLKLDDAVRVYDTNLILNSGQFDLNVFVVNNEYLCIDNKFMKTINYKDVGITLKGKTNTMPLIIEHDRTYDKALVLPVRQQNKPTYLKSLKGEE